MTANRLQHKIFYLKIQIKTSHLYNTVYKLVTKIISRNRDIIRFSFERLHNCCLSLLRLIYLYRKKSDEMYVFFKLFFKLFRFHIVINRLFLQFALR